MELLKVIKFEGDDDTLVWKHPDEDFNTKSQLIVHESQEAILFKDGKALDIFGPGKHELTTENIPILRGLINLPTEGVSPFHCEVYFINKAVSMNMNWGTSSRFQVLDPTFGIPISAGASGSMEFVINDSRKFLIKIVGTQNIVTSEKLVYYFREKTITKVKSYLSKIMSEISYLVINQHLEEISEAIKNKLIEDYDVYGVNLLNFYVSTIYVPDEDTDKVKEVLNKKMEYGQLGFNWADEQLVDITKRYASNPGSQDNVGAMAAQIPIAMAFGEMLKDNVIGGNENSFGDRANVFGGGNNIGAAFNTQMNQTQQNNNIFCRQCGESIPSNSKFCPSCGNKLDSELKCPECGNKIGPTDNFCLNCGYKLK